MPIVASAVALALGALIGAQAHAWRTRRLVGETRRTTERLRMVVENTEDAVIFATPTGEILEWNTAAESLFGFTRDDVLGLDALQLFGDTTDLDAIVDDSRERIRRQGLIELDLRMRLQGRTVPVHVQLAHVHDAEGEVAGFVAVARDDTRRLFAQHARETFAHLDPEHAVERFADALRAFIPFETLSLAAVEDDRFRELARVQLADGDSGDFVQIPLDQLFAGPLDEFGIHGLADAPWLIIGGSDFGEHEAEIASAGVHSAIVLALRDPLTDRMRGMLALGFVDRYGANVANAEALARVAPDLSQSMQNMILFARERETARELQELDDLREGFLAMIAHEVRSPLGAISTAAGVLRDQLDTMEPRDAKDIAAGIATGARHLSRLTGDLVDVGRGGQGRFPCLMKPVADFGVLVELTTRGVVGESTDRVTLEIESGIALEGDADRLAQITSNLVTNALKFSDAPVHVRVARTGNHAVLSVADQGPGIPPEHAHLVFRRFTRVTPPGAAPRPPGSGLGLFITRELVLAHGGMISQQPTPGGGATFEVWLPLSPVTTSA